MPAASTRRPARDRSHQERAPRPARSRPAPVTRPGPASARRGSLRRWRGRWRCSCAAGAASNARRGRRSERGGRRRFDLVLGFSARPMADFRRRSPAPNWAQPLAPRLTPTVKALIIALTLGYFFFVLAPPLDDWMVTHLLVGPNLWHGEVWQPLTGLFLNNHFMGWIFAVIGLWWVGAYVERTRGQRFFLGLYLGAGVAANVVAGALGYFVEGGPIVRGGGAAFARIYGAQPAQIWGAVSMRADYFTWILIGFSLLVSLVNRDCAGCAGELVAVGLAFVFTGGFASLQRRRQVVKRSRYQVIEGGKRRNPTTLN